MKAVSFFYLELAVALAMLTSTVPQAAIASSFASDQSVGYPEPDNASEVWTRQHLQRYFSDWQGVPYQYGGTDKRGVDCSGFVYRFYRDKYGLDIPRTTRLLAGMSKQVAFKQIAAGDILIFRNEDSSLHVGLYVADGMFIHASKSKGVMKSALSNPFWTRHYLKAVRVFGHGKSVRFIRPQVSL